MALGGRPFWVVAEEAKVTWRAAVPLEEGPPEQVWAPSPLLPVKVAHPLFDATPAALVRGYCTEHGVLTAKQLEPIAARHAQRGGLLT
jgi:methylthioribose-1-phosphate isomerase